jgi:hypothetical protein
MRCGPAGPIAWTGCGWPYYVSVSHSLLTHALPCSLLPCLPGGVQEILEEVVAVGAVGTPLACLGVVQVIAEDTVVFVQLWVPALC